MTPSPVLAERERDGEKIKNKKEGKQEKHILMLPRLQACNKKMQSPERVKGKAGRILMLRGVPALLKQTDGGRNLS